MINIPRNRFWKVIVFLLIMALMITGGVLQSAKAAATMEYNEAANSIDGIFTTKGGEVTRIEIYVSSSYEYYTNDITVTDTSCNASYKLRGSQVMSGGNNTTGKEIRYGGVVPVPSYGVNCIIYYFVSSESITWQMRLPVTEYLGECFVTKSKVPTNWEDAAAAVITESTEFLLYFIDAGISGFSSMSEIQSLFKANVKNDAVNDKKDLVGREEVVEESDPVMVLLVTLIFVTAIAIIITIIMLKKESARKETERSERYVAKANAKVKKKKSRENEELEELVTSYSEEYNDDEKESGNKESVGVTPAALPAISDAVPVMQTAMSQPQLQVAPNTVQPMPMLQMQPPMPGYLPQPPVQTYMQQPSYSMPQTRQQNAAGYPMQYNGRNNYPNINGQLQPNPIKKVPAFARKNIS